MNRSEPTAEIAVGTMNNTGNHLAAEYAAALREYLESASDVDLRQAGEIGRRALSGGAELNELFSAHRRAAIDALRRGVDPAQVLVRALDSAEKLSDQANARAARRFEFLAEASRVLCSSTDIPGALSRVARLAVPLLGELCLLNLADADGSVRQAEVAHDGTSDRAEALRGYRLFRSTSADVCEGIAVITPEWCDGVAENFEHATLLKRWCGRSVMVIPIRIRDRVAGALTFIASESGNYTAADLTLGEDLAARCGVALENARLFQRAVAERDRAESASRAKDEFLAVLSHEMRNPLMPVIGWVRLLNNHPMIQQDPVLAEGFHAMERNAMILRRLIGDCLDLSRIVEGKIQIERRPVDLKQVILTALEAVQPLAAEKELKVVPHLTGESILVLGDATRLEQVIMNLLMNAVKYTDAGGEIAVRCRHAEAEAEIEVNDTGVGIHPAILAQIFEPFQRASSARATQPSGLGLGLAIARRFVELHGGTIWADSQGIDRGSTFHVKLPIAALAASEMPGGPAAPSRPLETDPLKILLIEDSKDILFLLRVEFETAGHSVITAQDGSEGLELANAHHPDLIISDLKMPGMDGYGVIREIRRREELKRIPAIALTGLGSKADFDRAIAAGFDACIGKPCEPQEISALIHTLTERTSKNERDPQ